MQIDRLKLEDFRNYRSLESSFDPRCNVIYGENAQGKTNLLESIAYLSRGKSPRAKREREMIGFDRPSALLEGRAFSREREFTLRAELFRDRRRRLFVNKVAAKTGEEFSQVVKTVFFCPEDLDLIRQGAAARRKFCDVALCQLRPRYAAALAAYKRAWEQKTRILRDGEERFFAALPEFSEQMIFYGAILVDYRRRFVEKLGECAARHHLECSGGREELRVSYQTVSSLEDFSSQEEIARGLRRHMERHEKAERAARLCLSGPHKDDLQVSVNGQNAREYASQGQTRTAALSLKLAEREIYRDATGEYPVLLLDDVLSELDPRRQEFVLNRIAGGQVFLTCCEDDRLSEMLGGKVFHVKKGTIEG